MPKYQRTFSTYRIWYHFSVLRYGRMIPNNRSSEVSTQPPDIICPGLDQMYCHCWAADGCLLRYKTNEKRAAAVLSLLSRPLWAMKHVRRLLQGVIMEENIDNLYEFNGSELKMIHSTYSLVGYIDRIHLSNMDQKLLTWKRRDRLFKKNHLRHYILGPQTTLRIIAEIWFSATWPVLSLTVL